MKLTLTKIWFGVMAFALALSLSACAKGGVTTNPEPLETVVCVSDDGF